MMGTFRKWNELFLHVKIDSCEATTAGYNDVFTAVKKCVYVPVCVDRAVWARPSTGCIRLSKPATVIPSPLSHPLAYLSTALPRAGPWAHLQPGTPGVRSADTASTAATTSPPWPQYAALEKLSADLGKRGCGDNGERSDVTPAGLLGATQWAVRVFSIWLSLCLSHFIAHCLPCFLPLKFLYLFPFLFQWLTNERGGIL